ncbi:MAG: STAS domain-containing protein [Brachybacterium paraconglomeratum]|nr:STAS domain-containing protein [Brachybacterium paraconglomeratum]
MTGLASVQGQQLSDVRLVRVRGEIDLSNAQEVMDAISAAIPHDAGRVVLDLGATTYLDSTGISMVFRLAERLAHRRQGLRLVVPPASTIRAVLELADVPRVVPMEPTVDDACRPT